MKKRNDQAHQPPLDEFSDDRLLQKTELRLPKIDKGRASNAQLDKITTSSQNIEEPLLPRITRGERFTTSSKPPEVREEPAEHSDVHETLSDRQKVKEEGVELRRQTELDEPNLRDDYEAEFDVEQSAEVAQTVEVTDRDEFVKEVEDKLRAISDSRANGDQGNNGQMEAEGGDSDLSDFEQKVLQNREIIKKQLFKKKPSLAKKVDGGQKKPPQKKRNESLYEKRVREYRDNAENRFLKEKKKEIAAREVREKLKEERSQSPKDPRDARQRKRTPVRSRTDKYHQPGSAKEMPIIPSKELLKPAKEQNQDANARLFENIHTILQNPHKSRSEFLSLGKAKAIRGPPQRQLNELQEKLRQMDPKHNSSPQPQHQQQSPGHHATSSSLSVDVVSVKRTDHNLLDWRRISISPGRMIQMAESSFGGQVDRISAFIAKNEQSIGSYIRNRQLLMQIQLHNKLKQLDKAKQPRLIDDLTKRLSDAESI